MEEISRPWPLDAPRPCAARTSCPPVLPPPLPTPGRSACTSFLIFSALRANARSVALLALQGEDVGKERLTASTGLARSEQGSPLPRLRGRKGCLESPKGLRQNHGWTGRWAQPARKQSGGAGRASAESQGEGKGPTGSPLLSPTTAPSSPPSLTSLALLCQQKSPSGSCGRWCC